MILGSGWAAARLARDLDTRLMDLTLISPRNHMVFTPLLASATTGTVETRSVAVPLTDIQPALRHPSNNYVPAKATAVDPVAQVVRCESLDGITFSVGYDFLAIATGSQGSTFGVPGVEKHAFFLRELSHAEDIRKRLIDNLGMAAIPGRSEVERHRLLSTVIVGGGPTGVEFAGELADFIRQDLSRLRPELAGDMRITLVEANEILGSFAASLREYAAGRLMKQGVLLRRGVVKEVQRDRIVLKDGTELPAGLIVWSTGVGPTPFTLSLPFLKAKSGRLAVDNFLRCSMLPEAAFVEKKGGADPAANPAAATAWTGAQTVAGLEEPGQPLYAPTKAKAKPTAEGTPGAISNGSGSGPAAAESEHVQLHPAEVEPVVLENVFSLGDCSANLDKPLPALAQVAEQQGRYLACVLNERVRESRRGLEPRAVPPFVYKSLGSMATTGGFSGVLEVDAPARKGWISLSGFLSWAAWRGAYLTRLGNVRNRVYVAINWLTTALLGRDMSRW